MGAGGVELETHAFDPITPARSVLDLMAGQAEARDIWTTLETQGDIRPLIGDDGNNVIAGGKGNDVMVGGLGTDTADYSGATGAVKVSLAITAAQNTGSAAGTDTLSGFENLTGSAYGDTLTGDANSNVITGGAGNDKIDGGGGTDTLIGGTGNDTYYVDSTYDVVVEKTGEGTDTVIANATYTLSANVEKLTLTGTANYDGTGNELANTLTGNSGNNILSGLEGKDIISGGGGNDTLIGGLGGDTLTGGAGADTFVFDVLETAVNKDLIKDFTHGTDHIALARSAFAAFGGDAAGALNPLELALGTKATTAAQHLIYNQTTGALYYDDDGSGAHAQVQIALLTTKPVLDATDIVLL